MEEPCSAPSCSRPIYARQLCSAHYQQARLHGITPPSVATSTPCAYCGEPMTNRLNARAKFCSPQCKERSRTADRRRESRRGDRRCRQCGDPIPATRAASATFCSPDCQIKYGNAKQIATKKAANLAKRGPCVGCGAVIPDTVRSHAQFCSRECMNRTVRARNYDPARASVLNRLRIYGVTGEQYDSMLEAQGGKCAICRTEEPGGKGGWHVDHDHATGAVRGLLCHRCNLMLGNAQDDTVRLRAAADYLEGPPDQWPPPPSPS